MIPKDTIRALPYAGLIAFYFLLLVSWNTSYLACEGVPFMKSDIDNYLIMFTGDVDLTHSMYISQVSSFARLAGADHAHTIYYLTMWKLYLVWPIILFIFFCSIGRDLGRSGLAVVFLYSLTWWIPMKAVLGLHAQFESMMFFIMFATASELRRKAPGFELDLIWYGSAFFSLVYHPYSIIPLLIFCAHRYDLRLFLLTPIPLAYMLHQFGGLVKASVIIGLDEKVSSYTAFMFAGACILGLLERRDRPLVITYVILGIISDNHRLYLYALPWLAYGFAGWYRGIKWYAKGLFVLFGLWYMLETVEFWAVQFYGELLHERTIGLECFSELFKLPGG